MQVKILLNTPLTEELVEHGYLEADKFDSKEDAERFWDLCNWSHRDTTKPMNLFSDIEHCGHGIVFINPENNLWYLALSAGWLCGTENDIRDYIHRNHKNLDWILDER